MASTVQFTPGALLIAYLGESIDERSAVGGVVEPHVGVKDGVEETAVDDAAAVRAHHEEAEVARQAGQGLDSADPAQHADVVVVVQRSAGMPTCVRLRSLWTTLRYVFVHNVVAHFREY